MQRYFTHIRKTKGSERAYRNSWCLSILQQHSLSEDTQDDLALLADDEDTGGNP